MRKTLLLIVLIFSAYVTFAKNNALIIGIGNYDTSKTGWNKIHGNNDVALLQHKLKAQGFVVSTLVDQQATKQNVVYAIKKIVASAAAGDNVYIHFSGHGQLIEDVNSDEEDGYDQSFICYDACRSSKDKIGKNSYKGQYHLIDDELFPYLNQLKQKVGSKGSVIVIFDTCYSGGEERGSTSDDYNPEYKVEWVNTVRGTEDEFEANQITKPYLQTIRRPGKYNSGFGTLTAISACERDQRNYECRDKYSGKSYGSLSYCIGKLIDKKVPITEWGKYFKNKKYVSLKVFRPSQHPVVEQYK